MRLTKCHLAMLAILMLAATFVFVMWQRGSHVTVSWPSIAIGAAVLTICALMKALRRTRISAT
jgi:hypothetical protein